MHFCRTAIDPVSKVCLPNLIISEATEIIELISNKNQFCVRTGTCLQGFSHKFHISKQRYLQHAVFMMQYISI